MGVIRRQKAGACVGVGRAYPKAATGVSAGKARQSTASGAGLAGVKLSVGLGLQGCLQAPDIWPWLVKKAEEYCLLRMEEPERGGREVGL